MIRYDFYNDSVKNLAVISAIYSLFINTNNTIALIHNFITNSEINQSLYQWMLGISMVFFISFATLVVNLHILPSFSTHSKTAKFLKNFIVNVLLYIIFVFTFYFIERQINIYESDRVIPHLFGWTVVYVISLFIYNMVKYQRNRKLEQKEKEILITEKLKSELNEIKAVINPHFLFNSLNTLNALIKIDSDKASIFTTHLSRLYRYILSNRNKDLITIKEELFFINDYVELLKIRYKNCFDININIKDNQLNFLIPPLSLQLLIENAEKHNTFTEASPLMVSISIENEYLIVSHPLMERKAKINSMGNGLSSLTKRCRILFKKDLYIIKNKNFIVKVPLFTTGENHL